jgi:hypothetical protein
LLCVLNYGVPQRYVLLLVPYALAYIYIIHILINVCKKIIHSSQKEMLATPVKHCKHF